MGVKSNQMFDGIMKGSDKLSDTTYKATTAKRLTVIIPIGIRVFDTDEKKFYDGDDATYGGVSSTSQLKVRKIVVNAAASAGLSADATTDKITWTTYGSMLRTGDAITIAAGTGTVPSGTSATTYYVVKEVQDPAAASFKIASSRANALAGTTVNILGSGIPGWTSVMAQVSPNKGDEVLIFDPLAAAVTTYLPYPTTGYSPQFTIKRAAAGDVNLTIAALNSAGAAATLTLDDAASNITLASGSVAKGYTVWGDPASHEYFTIAKVTA